MEPNLIAEGLKFMVLGMVTVFLFLTVMVFILNIQAKLTRKFLPEKAVSSKNNSAVASQSPSGDNKALVAAITAAIQTFKSKKV